MLALRIAAANTALVVVWCGALALLGFRLIPMQIALLVLGLATSSALVTRALIDREAGRRDRRLKAPGAELSAVARRPRPQ